MSAMSNTETGVGAATVSATDKQSVNMSKMVKNVFLWTCFPQILGQAESEHRSSHNGQRDTNRVQAEVILT